MERGKKDRRRSEVGAKEGIAAWLAAGGDRDAAGEAEFYWQTDHRWRRRKCLKARR